VDFSWGEMRPCCIPPGEKLACVAFLPGRNSHVLHFSRGEIACCLELLRWPCHCSWLRARVPGLAHGLAHGLGPASHSISVGLKMPHDLKQACQIAIRLLLRPLRIKLRLLLHALHIKLRELRLLAIGSASWLAIGSASRLGHFCILHPAAPLDQPWPI
jgi:hypothetical protein